MRNFLTNYKHFQSIHPKVANGYACTKDTKADLFISFINQFLTEGIAILTITYYQPEDLNFQHAPVKYGEGNTKVKKMRKVYITVTLISIDLQENIKIVGKIFEIYYGLLYNEKCKVSPFRSFDEQLYQKIEKRNGKKYTKEIVKDLRV